MKFVMGYARTRGGKCHLVNADDLAVSLCGVYIPYENLLRSYGGGDLIIFADHWRNGMCGISSDRNCLICEEKAGVS